LSQLLPVLSRERLKWALSILNAAGGEPNGVVGSARSCLVGAMVFVSGPDGLVAAASAAIQSIETVRNACGEAAARDALSRLGKAVAAAI